MTDTPQGPREWWTDGVAIITNDEEYIKEIIETDAWNEPPIRVIEFAAYEKVRADAKQAVSLMAENIKNTNATVSLLVEERDQLLSSLREACGALESVANNPTQSSNPDIPPRLELWVRWAKERARDTLATLRLRHKDLGEGAE